MPPFNSQILVEGIKDRIEALVSHGDRLFLGTSVGNLLVYSLDKLPDGTLHATLEETKAGLVRRSIEQLGIIKDTHTLVTLSDAAVFLHPLPALTPTQTIPDSKGALCFAINTTVEYTNEDGTTTSVKDPAKKQVPAVITMLAIGCKRRILLCSWKDGEPQPSKELPLPHSPRAMAFPTSKVIAMAYTQTDHALIYMETMSTADIVLPTTATPGGAAIGLTGAMGYGMNAFSGLGGYMTLGLGAKAKPTVLQIGEDEFLIPKDNSSLFFGTNGKPSRKLGIEWPATPDEIALVKPYLASIFPAGSVPSTVTSMATTAQQQMIPNPVLQIRSSLSLSVTQTERFPFQPLKGKPSPTSQHALRLLNSSVFGKDPLFLMSSPNDRTALATEGSILWMFRMQSWETQIDELVQDCKYSDALALLDSLEDGLIPDKIKRRSHIRALHAVALLAQGHAADAINIFLNLDVNPAKVFALFPPEMSGRLAQPQSKWIELFGEKPLSGTTQHTLMDDVGVSTISREVTQVLEEGQTTPQSEPANPEPPKKAATDLRNKIDKEAITKLLDYISDCRRKISGALMALHITSSQEAKINRLSEAPLEELLALPDAPPSALTPQQLFRFAQIVDTALFKSYLIVRPGLVGALCRLDNWCEVSEVENELRARGKFSELTFLYQGKKMHGKALDLLKDLSAKEDDIDDKVDPTVTYLQKLGPEYLDLISESAKWVLSLDKKKGLQIFTTEEHELPRLEVASYLEEIDLQTSIQYIEHLIGERKEDSNALHDRLAELYMHHARDPHLSADARSSAESKFTSFLESSKSYRADRILAQLPSEAMLEARAILFGRLGEHKAALSIYVYDLQNYQRAEDYCKAVHLKEPDLQSIFMMLLKLYLRPEQAPTAQISYLKPALGLISRHSPRLDSVETLQLLPPLVTASDVSEYLSEALRTRRIDVRIEREMWKTRDDQLARKLMEFESKRVKIDSTRLCPQCHKRLDRSVIAVHAPRGEVTHYHCREAFTEKLRSKEKSLQATKL